jgi:hypothetical protein
VSLDGGDIIPAPATGRSKRMAVPGPQCTERGAFTIEVVLSAILRRSLWGTLTKVRHSFDAEAAIMVGTKHTSDAPPQAARRMR